jgi:engulfment/cell motility protein 1
MNVAAGPLQNLNDVPSLNLAASPISFSLLSVRGGESLGDHVASDASGWADWTDGLNMLRRDGGHVATSETAGYVDALTEIGLKIKLLGKEHPSITSPALPIAISI